MLPNGARTEILIFQERPRNYLRSKLQQHSSLAIFQRGVCGYRLGIKHVKALAGIETRLLVDTLVNQEFNVLRQERKMRVRWNCGYHGYRLQKQEQGRKHCRCKAPVSPLSVAAETISASLEAFLRHPGDSLGDQNVLSESLLLEKLERSNCRARVAEEGNVNM